MLLENLNRLSVLAIAVTAVVASGSAVAQTAQKAEFDFEYKMGGERAVLPLQVFDDGKSTYFQFRERANSLPAIMVQTEQGLQVVNYHRSGPYVVVPGVAQQFELRFGSINGVVRYTGQARPAAKVTTTGSAPAAADKTTAQVVPGPMRAVMSTPAAGGLADPVAAGGVATPAEAGQSSVQQPAPAAVPPRSNMEPSAMAPGLAPTTVAVPFEMGQSALTRDGQEAIRRAFAGQGAIASVMIIGRDDPVMVDGLARQRAMAIRAAALRAGAPTTAITVREGLVRETDEAGVYTSDLRVVRAAPAPAAMKMSGTQGEPRTVGEALSMVQRGLSALTRMGRLTGEFVDNMMLALRKLVGMGDEPASAPAAPTSAVDRPAGEGMHKVRASLTGAGAQAESVWVMLPADGTAREGLGKWAKAAGVELVWEADVDYPLTRLVVVRGTARAAFENIRQALEAAQTPLTIEYAADRLIVRNYKGKNA